MKTEQAGTKDEGTGRRSVNWEAVRADFPILFQKVQGHDLVYLDNAASSQKPRQVLDAMVRYYEHDNANVHRGLHELSSRATAAYEGARETVARYLGAENPGEVVFTRGTTEGVNLVANAWGGKFVKEGDVILLTEMEHHSNLVPWLLLAERSGARIRYVPVTAGGLLDLERLPELLTPEVKIFAFTHVSNSLGTVNPAAELCRMARSQGVTTLVDAAQSAGHMPLNVREMGCDFLVFSGHKMCAPTGIGALYGRMSVLEAMPPWHGGGEMINAVTYERATYKAPPHRFEAGTPNIGGAVGLAAAVDYLEAIGRESIHAHDTALVEYALERLVDVPGLKVIGPVKGRASLVSFVLEAAHPHDLTTYADRYGLALRGGHHCNQPLMRKFGLPGTTRASFYFYNTPAEVDRMIEVLGKAQQFFA
jgi:cysteine desulfurase/selenocysteine lyase